MTDIPPAEGNPQDSGSQPKTLGKRVAILALFVALIGIVLSTGVQDFLSLESLRENRQALLDFVAGNYVGAVLAFMAIYVLAVTFSIPDKVSASPFPSVAELVLRLTVTAAASLE